jgi:murein DD-endopeptidase MepM/ murein hydrolase activator NlpD
MIARAAVSAIAALWLIGCSPQSTASFPNVAAPASATTIAPLPPTPEPPVPPPLASSPPVAASSGITCAGIAAQGGVLVCRTTPGAPIHVDGVARGAADRDGYFVVGVDRDAEGPVRITSSVGSMLSEATINVAKRAFSVQRVDGLPPQTVTPTAPAVLAKIAEDRKLKDRGFSSRADANGFLQGFMWPVSGRMSGPWGNQRVLNGEPRAPHFGIDIAAPTGTAVVAPAGGVIALAEPDLHFEGGFILIDHGQGLLTMYLHLSRLDVAEGEVVTQGQRIGAVGASGRTTGPHLCWRMKWRDRNIDPSLALYALNGARETLGVGASIPTGAAPVGFTPWTPSP